MSPCGMSYSNKTGWDLEFEVMIVRDRSDRKKIKGYRWNANLCCKQWFKMLWSIG